MAILDATSQVARDLVLSSLVQNNDELILATSAVNDVIDCCAVASMDKMALLSTMKERFGRRCEVTSALVGVSAIGLKATGFSFGHRAKINGHKPSQASFDRISDETRLMANGHNQ